MCVKAAAAQECSRAMSSTVVLPGEAIPTEPGFLRGHGTFLASPSGALASALPGVVERVNKLVSVRPLGARYAGDVGDVVVGRVREVGSKRWRVDVGGRQDAVLLLSSVNLSGGEQRRRTFEDAMAMRSFFAEDDVLSAEVHAVFPDGSLSLHARSLKYGRLVNGAVVPVRAGLVRRLKQHFVSLPCGVDAVLGINGVVWLTETPPPGEGGGHDARGGPLESVADAVDADAGLADAVEARKAAAAARAIGPAARERIARARNAVLALSAGGLPVTPESITDVVDESLRLGLTASALAGARAAADATAATRARLAAAAAAAARE